MTTEWLKMNDLKKHIFNNKSWIPLYAQHIISKIGEMGHEGFSEEYFGTHSVIVSQNQKTQALNLEWMDVSNFNHKPWIDDENVFHSAAIYEHNGINGFNPVLIQDIEVETSKEVHINQDIILALGLKRDGDRWVCPEEDYIEVIKLERDNNGKPNRLEIKAEFLKDYLCALNCGLILLTYQSRKVVKKSFNDLNWKEDNEEVEKTDFYKWSGILYPIYQGFFPFDQTFHVYHVSRTDTDYSEDVPIYNFPTDETTHVESYDVKFEREKIIQAMAEIWKKEWITPATKSRRVKRDKVSSKIEFIVDNEENTETSETLIEPSRWLWFHPDVINDLLKKQTSVLSWYTRDTGNVGGAWNYSVPFGVNSMGLITVYAKDIGQLREIDKKIWAKHNVSPDGRVSDELLMAQMEARPANTKAPETIFLSLVDEINTISESRLKQKFFTTHSFEEEISKKIHRFQVVNLEGIYLLCKEITRFLIERIDMDFLKNLKKEKEEKLGTIKRLERILTALGYDGYAILGTLVGVYDLRLIESHLPSMDKIPEALKLVGVNYKEMRFNSGRVLLENVNASLEQIREAFDKGDFTKVK